MPTLEWSMDVAKLLSARYGPVDGVIKLQQCDLVTESGQNYNLHGRYDKVGGNEPTANIREIDNFLDQEPFRVRYGASGSWFGAEYVNWIQGTLPLRQSQLRHRK